MCAAVLLLSGPSSPAGAQALDLNKISGWVDLRGAVSTAGEEWLDGGTSKTRYGGPEDTNLDAEVAEVTVLWEPRFLVSLSGHFNPQAGPDQDMPVSAVETFLRWRAPPRSAWRISAKLGRYFPPISLEHDGPAWSLTRSITPSAINSWIGEEVAVIGLEGRAARVRGDHFFDMRAAAFGFNDTAGALLAFRGWALHDIRTVIGGSFALPDDPGRRLSVPLQAERTNPTEELDNRVGFHGSARWRYSDLLQVDLLGYDNRADPEALRDGQYGWRTRFISLGLKFTPNDVFEILAQSMAGSTQMGPISPINPAFQKFDDEFLSGYVLASLRHDHGQFSARVDYFEVANNVVENTPRSETGWAITAAWIKSITKHVRVGLEALYVTHDRTIAPAEENTKDVQLQTSIQLRF
ncbi:MAG: hypothetical protein AAF862_10120 [Pseudomonadota bacterium]